MEVGIRPGEFLVFLGASKQFNILNNLNMMIYRR